MIFPEILTNEDFEYPEGTKQPETALADGLSGWGCCMAGGTPSESFGKGMVKIGKIVGVSATPDSLSNMADILIKKKK